MTPLAILAIGMASPLGRNVADHLSLCAAMTADDPTASGAETSVGRSARLVDDAGTEIPALGCEWLPAGLPPVDRLVALARQAAHEALRGVAHQAASTDVALELVVDAATGEQALQAIQASLVALPGVYLGAVHRGGCGLVDALLRTSETSHENSTNALSLVVAVDSLLTLPRHAAQPQRSPWEPAALPLSEAAAALLLTTGAGDATALGRIEFASSCQGPVRAEGDVDGAPLTRLLHELPAAANVKRVRGRRSGELDGPLSWTFAAARVAAAAALGKRQPLSDDHQCASLCDEIGDVGAAELTIELAFGIAEASAAGTALSLLAWARQEDGRWATCFARAGLREQAFATTRDPASVETAPTDNNVSLRMTDRFAAGEWERAAVGELLGDLIARATDRWTLKLAAQPGIERRLRKQLRALVLGASEIAPALAQLRADEVVAARPLAFVGALALAHHDSDALAAWLRGCDMPRACWAAAEGLALACCDGGPLNDAALHELSESSPEARAAALLARVLLSLEQPADAPLRQRIDAWFASNPPVAPQLSSLWTATLLHSASYLPGLPWAADVVLQWLDVEDAEIGWQAARLLALHRQVEAFEQLGDEAFIDRLGAHALSFAALHPALLAEAQLAPILTRQLQRPATAAHPAGLGLATLRTLGRIGHPGSWQLLSRYLADPHLQDAAIGALTTLFGTGPAQGGRDAWTRHIAELELEPTRRTRRGQPWSPAVVQTEVQSQLLGRDAAQHRYDELRATGADVLTPPLWRWRPIPREV